MFAVLLFTVIGFLAGLIYVIRKRNIRLGYLLTTTIVGLMVSGFAKILNDSQRRKRRY